MTEFLEYLKSSELVYEVQSYFGVKAANEGPEKKKFKVGNKFYYYLFLLGTELGERTLKFELVQVIFFIAIIFFR
jgi:hypothetical protein